MSTIAIASGKGGTGKTTVATSLALAISDLSPVLLDCDVEAPNAHISLQARFDRQREVTLPIPEVDQNGCTGCGRCAEVCQYHAIVVVGGKVLVFPQLCHGCGSCTLQCPEDAITEIPRPLGLLEAGQAMAGIRLARGLLNIGEPMAVPVIRELKSWSPFTDAEVVIRDVSPGTSCPVVEAIRGADFVLLVTEPTPFGLHDLKLAVQLTRELNLPIGVVINRDGVGDDAVDEYCHEQGIPILMRIPLERRIGEALAQGRVFVDAFPEYMPDFVRLYQQILSRMHQSEVATQPLLQFQVRYQYEANRDFKWKRGHGENLPRGGYELVIVDGPPGIGCPVISAASGADLALIVTEPSTTGIHDLQRILQTTLHFGIQSLVCINKADINVTGTEQIYSYCQDMGVEVVGTIPYDISVTEAMTHGEPVTAYLPDAMASKAIIRIWSNTVAELSEAGQ